MAAQLPSVGTRLCHSGSLGTVRFVGPVDGTKGVWLGVDWDDPHRGKHDGSKDGKPYFMCLLPNSGSFIRPSPAISYGTSFLSALVAKYVDAPRADGSLEKVILGSSGGAIEVEAVGLDRIRGKLSHLERLREVSLDNENVADVDPPGEIGKTCPGVRGLNLSKNLIPTWDIVATISRELPALRSLSLNHNRLRVSEGSLAPDAFLHLDDLELNATLTTWPDFLRVLSEMPSLRVAEMGGNRLRALSSPPGTAGSATLQTLNLDENELDSFSDVCSALRAFPSLQRLILTSNAIGAISPPPDVRGLRSVRHLALAFNRLASWADIDALPLWFPALETLTFAGNPLSDGDKENARPFAIARLPELQALDGARITSRERVDSELLYISHVGKHGPADPDARAREHPRWRALCDKHGMDEEHIAAPDRQDTLSNRLINVAVFQTGAPPSTGLSPTSVEQFLAQHGPPIQLRALTSMNIRTVRMKALKSCKVPRVQQPSARLWMAMPNAEFVELVDEYDSRDLAWLGVEEGARFVLSTV